MAYRLDVKRWVAYFGVVLLPLLFGSCMTVGPDYELPEVGLPDSWAAEIAADNASAINGSQLWWQKYGDATLNRLIAEARKNNPNLAIAKSRITESWHQRGVIAAALYPKFDLAGRDEYGILNYDREGVHVNPGTPHGQLLELQYGWELDIFGKIKRQTEATEGEYDAKIEGWRDANVFITAEVALTYIAFRTLERRIEVAEEGKASYEEIQRRIKERVDLGVTSELDMEQVTARYKTSAAEIPRLIQEKILVRNRLAQLVVVEPGKMAGMLKSNRKIPAPPKSVAVGVPAELLRSRPDIRRAERKMAAQTARIGVAEAMLYPELSLSGALVYEYLSGGVPAALLRRVMGGGSSLKWRIFHASADQHRIKEHEALLEQAIGVYQQVILQAITDVENAMTRVHYSGKRLVLLGEARRAHQKVAGLMQQAYEADEVDLQRLLNAQQDYIATLDEEVAEEGRRAAHTVRLFKALGGGELAGVPEKKGYRSLAKRGFWSFFKK